MISTFDKMRESIATPTSSFDGLRALASLKLKSNAAPVQFPSSGADGNYPGYEKALVPEHQKVRPSAELPEPKTVSAKKVVSKGITKCLTALSSDSLKLKRRALKSESMQRVFSVTSASP
jgi:hypothetical protein